MNKKFFMIALAITMLFVLVACKSATNEDFRTNSDLEGIADTADYSDVDNETENGTSTSTADYSDTSDVDSGHFEYTVRIVPNENSPVRAGLRAPTKTLERIVESYQQGEWNGSFDVADGHCYSIDAEGYLWVDCAKARYTIPDLPNGECYLPRVGFDGDITTVYLLESSNSPNQLDKQLVAKIQHLYYEGYFDQYTYRDTPCYEIVTDGDSYFVAYDVYSHELVVNNVVYHDVNLDVPVTCKDVIGDWGFHRNFALLYDMGEPKKVLTMPAEVESLVTATDDSIIFVDRNSNLWHVSEETTVKVATRVSDTAGVNGFIAYLRADGTAYTYSVWDDAGSTKLASNATDVDFYGDYGFGAVVTTEESSNTVRDGKLLYLEHTWED